MRFWVRSRDSRNRSSVAGSNFHGTVVGHRRPPKPRPYSPQRATSPLDAIPQCCPCALTPEEIRRRTDDGRLRVRARRRRLLPRRPRPRCHGPTTRPPRVARCRNVRRLPFRGACHGTLVRTCVRRSGTTHPTPMDVTSETFSTSALRVPTEVEATATAICTRRGSTPSRDDASTRAPPPSYSPTRRPREREHCADGRVSVGRCNAIHCRGPAIRSVSCYTLHGRCRLP